MKKLFTLILVLVALFAVSQNIEITDGLYYKDNKLYKGVYKEYGSDGVLSAEMSVKKGRLDGKTIVYFPNGSKKEVRGYSNGLKSGKWLVWNEAGSITALAIYKNDKKHGTWIIWDDAGQKRYEMKYHFGEKTGIWYMWDEKGVLIMEKSYKVN